MTPDQDGVLQTPGITLEGENTMPVDPSNLEVALTGMANGAAASHDRRASRADQLAGDADRMWTVAMTTPTQFAAQAYQTASEAGSGRTRPESNLPAATSASGN